MYAVVESGGKQYRVEKGDALLVDRLPQKEGASVSLRPVVFSDKEMVIDRKSLDKVVVEAKVAEHLRGPKILVFKKKRKKGYKRRAGHRSELTRLEVTGISGTGGGGAAKKPAAKKPAAKKAAAKKAPARTKKEAGDGS
ncbi:MAG: 50S ribosomal protein L21 [Solirubrobacterales bacterium]